MSQPRRSVCLITSGLLTRNLKLQPWRYLHEVAQQLIAQGHKVTVISDGNGNRTQAAHEEIGQVPVMRLKRISYSRWGNNLPLHTNLQEIAPDVILWHVGLTSFVHQCFESVLDVPIVGIFTSPLYKRDELARLGIKKIALGHQLSAVHALNTWLPTPYLRRRMGKSQLHSLVVQTQTTKRNLLQNELWHKSIQVISPGVDPIWQQPHSNGERTQLGYKPSDKVILYFGSPAPLRGLHTLIEAFELARQQDEDLKLLILSRRHAHELFKQEASLKTRLNRPEIKAHVKIISGYLEQEQLVNHVAACDVVALPFELVPSDAPLTLLEAQALGKPVVTTDVACLAELVAQGNCYLAQPANAPSLAKALLQASNRENKGARHLQNAKQQAQTPLFERTWQQMGQEWSNLIQTL